MQSYKLYVDHTQEEFDQIKAEIVKNGGSVKVQSMVYATPKVLILLKTFIATSDPFSAGQLGISGVYDDIEGMHTIS